MCGGSTQLLAAVMQTCQVKQCAGSTPALPRMSQADIPAHQTKCAQPQHTLNVVPTGSVIPKLSQPAANKAFAYQTTQWDAHSVCCNRFLCSLKQSQF